MSKPYGSYPRATGFDRPRSPLPQGPREDRSRLWVIAWLVALAAFLTWLVSK